MNNGNARASLIGIVGAYLLYTAYDLFRNEAGADTTMSPAVRILFSVFFVLAGIALLVLAVRIWRRSAKEEKEQQDRDDERTGIQ